MTRRTRELLAVMAQLNQAVPTVALGIMDESLTVVKQIEFGDLLVQAGRLLHDHARPDGPIIVDSEDASAR